MANDEQGFVLEYRGYWAKKEWNYNHYFIKSTNVPGMAHKSMSGISDEEMYIEFRKEIAKTESTLPEECLANAPV